MSESAELKKRIFDQLRTLRDPATSVDVVRMRIVRALDVSEGGHVRLILKPNSNICPVVANLATTMKTVVEGIKGVTKVDMTIIDHIQAEMLNRLLNE